MAERATTCPRVLYVVRLLRWVSGTARTVADVVNGLDRGRFDPVMCVFDPIAGDDENFPRLDATYVDVTMRHGDEAFHRWDIGFLMRLLRVVRRERISVIHSHCIEGLWYGAACKWLTGVKLVHTHQQPQLPHGRKKRGWAMRRMAGACDAFAAVSHTQGRILCDRYSVDPDLISVVYNAVDCDRFQPDPAAREDVRREFERGPGQPLIGAVGRFVGQKNFPLMMHAFRHILQARPDALLVIAGDGHGRPAVESLARELGIADAVRFLGRRNDVPRLMNGFDLFLSTAVSESFGIVFAEAAASGTPVVTTKAVVAPEIVNDGVGGVVVLEDEPEPLAKAVVDLLSDPDRLTHLRKTARDWAVSSFSARRLADCYQQLYDRSIAGRRAHGAARDFPLRDIPDDQGADQAVTA